MKREYTFADLGKPAKPGIWTATDGTRINLDEVAFDKWKSKDFVDKILVKLVHDPEHMGGAIYTILLV